MKILSTTLFIMFSLSACFSQNDQKGQKENTGKDTKECTQKILLDNKQCMEITAPGADWKKISLNHVKPGLVIMVPPKATVYGYRDAYATGITVNFDTTQQDLLVSIIQNTTDEWETYTGCRSWLLKTSRTCFEFLHDCNTEVILRVKDNTVALDDRTSYSSFAEKELAGDRYSFYADGIIIRDMAKNDMTRLTLEDNMDLIKIFRSLKIE